ncbi:Mitochondrial chaperone Frataxin [Serendipita sp. 400]|nr:Mitochondrial chaperone Frataxin [Serendipita sp. 400]
MRNQMRKFTRNITTLPCTRNTRPSVIQIIARPTTCKPSRMARASFLMTQARPKGDLHLQIRHYATPQPESTSTISTGEYHAFADETMEALLTSLENLVDGAADAAYEVEYSSGVLTLKLGETGTYVINKQPPNKQIWLSSPISGPKRYDYNTDSGKWMYTRDSQSLGQLLEQELSTAFDKEVRLGIEPKENV